MELRYDPLYKLGFGTYSYLRFQQDLKKYLMFLSLIAIIKMILFYHDISADESKVLTHEHDKLSPVEKITSYFSLGSYYQAYPMCHHVYLKQNHLKLQCRGDMQI